MTTKRACGPNSRSSINNASRPAIQSPGHRVTLPDVLRCLQRPGTRELAMTHYKAAGWTGNDFDRRREAREVMADAITAVEDWLEENHPRWFDAVNGCRDVRRRLELELWP